MVVKATEERAATTFAWDSATQTIFDFKEPQDLIEALAEGLIEAYQLGFEDYKVQLMLCYFCGHLIGHDQLKASLEERVRKIDARAKVAKERKKATKEAKEGIEEIAQLKTERHTVIEKITSLEYTVKLERLMVKDLGMKIKLVKVYAIIENVKVVVGAIEASLWAYDFNFDECKIMV
ncbi:hypothetical protein COCNU_scaffold003477G000020 [Cocos nucifera]|nr:hypothetical protein [Cocos nucifera]